MNRTGIVLLAFAGWALGACGGGSSAGAKGGALDGSAGGGSTGSDAGSGSMPGSADATMSTGGTEAGPANDTADGILTNLFGSRSGPSGAFSAATFSHGFATYVQGSGGVNTLTVYLTNYADGCSYARAGGFLEGGQTFQMSVTLTNAGIASMTEYESNTASTSAVAVEDAPMAWTSGVNCSGPDADVQVAPPVVSTPFGLGGLLIYAFDAARVTGHFSFSQSTTSDVVNQLDGIFDLPICDFPGGDAGLAPSSFLCLPPIGRAPTNPPITPCAGVTVPTVNGGTLTDLVGTATWTGDAGSFPSTAFNTGFASIETLSLYPAPAGLASLLYLTFADYPNSCGDGLAGGRAAGGHTFGISVGHTKDSDGGYPVAFVPETYTNVSVDGAPSLWSAAADGACLGVVPPFQAVAGDTVVLTAADSAHVAGTFSLPAPGDAGALSGAFDLPLCEPPSYDGGAPQICCF
jgi:hypothetical protein